MERQKAEVANTKQQGDTGGISSSNKDNDNYYSDTDGTNLDQKDNLNLVQSRNDGREVKDNTD